MIFVLVSVFVPLIVYFVLPQALKLISASGRGDRRLLAVGCLLFAISWYLPSPEIQGQQTAAVTHFLGGGVFAGFIWLYVKQAFGWRGNSSVELLSLFAVVSMLGVANELFELLVVQIGVVHLDMADTPWDLLMNTLGAFTFFIGHKVAVAIGRRWGS